VVLSRISAFLAYPKAKRLFGVSALSLPVPCCAEPS
jgi:hypothetical protein